MVLYWHEMVVYWHEMVVYWHEMVVYWHEMVVYWHVDCFILTCMWCSNYMYSGLCRYRKLRGFVKLKKFQKSEKNSEMDGWVKPQLGLLFFGNIVFFCVVFFVVHVSNFFFSLDRWVFLGFLEKNLTWQDPLHYYYVSGVLLACRCR